MGSTAVLYTTQVDLSTDISQFQRIGKKSEINS